ncbi:hypothetical protein [Reichenbachiella sp. MSK19-1]|uniref:hypothetical protein n=1 Tax=Reichenbachiella sp. MSK19-1 TaxID=1897631 RepID=UPI000E6CA266|nr:hypothetical protein [Reichenbachiella sp. MSK19-1]RJE72571.1 hypothetical protein BGP76_00950 [Reichenbachiella sp. MSK19-1]
MSIFPKRTIQGETVTIHWNFNTSNLNDFHVLPWVRIGIKNPLGKVTMLFEEHVLGLPDEPKELKTEEPKLKYLNKSVPLLLLADYLSGKHKKEKLVEILENIQSGRHYYFTYKVPKNAPLGKYHLISEIHINGELRLSKTAADDFFFVEKMSSKKIEKFNDHHQALIFNHSPEKTPVKIVGCIPTLEGKMQTTVNVFEMGGYEEKKVPLTTSLSFLLYNEERQVIPLQESFTNFLLRNQQISPLNKSGGDIYLFKKENTEAYHLNESQRILWQKANGLLKTESLTKNERMLLEEMVAEDLIHYLSL